MRQARLVLCALTFFAPFGLQTRSEKPLDVYFIDVEGGQATLLVSPSGESMLVDTGFPGFDGRDAGRVLAALKQAGLSRLDYLIVTHYHSDHVGNAAALAAKVPVGTFVDHGPTVEHGDEAEALYAGYVKARTTGKHLQATPGARIPIAGLDVTIVSAAGAALKAPLPGAGAPNPFCSAFTPKAVDAGENAQSVGVVISHGRFRMLDLGDLTWNKEHDLVCPNNLLGTVDVYLTTHHGFDQSGSAVVVHAVRPRVAIMNNGPKKGGSPDAWQIVHESPGLQDLWQLHYAVDAGAAHNTSEPLIANLDESTAHGIELSALRDGSFTVTNGRTGVKKTYK